MKTIIGKLVVIRGYYCGNWIGKLEEVNTNDGRTVTLSNAYRLWSWDANNGISLSTVAVKGLKAGNIPCAVEKVVLTDCYEIIVATEVAYVSVKNLSK